MPSPLPSTSAPADAGAPDAALPTPSPTASTKLSVRAVPLPGANGPLSLDYLAYERSAGRVWIPAAGTGSVDVLEIASGKLTRIQGFATVEREVHRNKRLMGPSSATLGEGVAYVGNRASAEVCAIDASTLARGACVKLDSSPDGVLYVAATKELWITTPRDKSLTILDASTPAKLSPKTKIALQGEPEGYAVDETRGIFYTNLEDKDQTLQIDASRRPGKRGAARRARAA
jgi:hypothetical protein